jgi:hypothetical protein
MAATAEAVAVTCEHISNEAGEADSRAAWFRRAEAERREAQRLWDLTEKLEA